MKAHGRLQQGLLAAIFCSATAFSVHPRISSPNTLLSSSSVLSAKGFGTQPEDDGPKPTTTTVSLSNEKEETPMNAGQKALAEMRRQRAEQKDAELRKVRELMEADQQTQETPATIPEEVAQRMGKRMLPFVGIPLFLTLGSFVAFWYLSVYQNYEFSPSLVAGSSALLLVAGLLGITYSMMSSSWDPDREGSALGIDEFQKNVDNVKEGLSRSRKNTLLRDKMTGLSEKELNKALSDLDRRDKQKNASLQSKLEEELE